MLLGAKTDGVQGRTESLAPIVDDELQAILAADALGFQDLEELDPFFGAFAFAEPPKQDLTAVAVRPNTHSYQDGTLEPSFDRTLAAFAVAAHLTVGAHEGHPDGVDLQDGWHIFCLTVGVEVDELMQPFVQSAQRQRANVRVHQLLAHLPQTHSHAPPALDLGVQVIPKTLIGAKQVTKIDLHTATAFAPHPRQLQGPLAPFGQQRAPGAESIPTKKLTAAGSTATARAFSTQLLRDLLASNVVGPTDHIAHDSHEQRVESSTDDLTERVQRLVKGYFIERPSIDRSTSLGYS